jgi:oxidase EvaA
MLHFLLKGSVEVGFREKVQFGPTVQSPPIKGEEVIPQGACREVQAVMDENHIEHVNCMLSEEGGRFYQSVSNYRVIEVPERTVLPTDQMYCWATLGQIYGLLKTPGVFTNEARSAIALLLPWLTGPRKI